MIGVAINIGVHAESFEIDISGNAIDFVDFAKQLSQNLPGVISLRNNPSDYFLKSIKLLSTKLLEDSKGLITVEITDDELRFSGDLLAFKKLIDFLDSVPNLSPGEHYHLDQFDHEDLLDPTTSNMSFIFSMEA